MTLSDDDDEAVADEVSQPPSAAEAATPLVVLALALERDLARRREAVTWTRERLREALDALSEAELRTFTERGGVDGGYDVLAISTADVTVVLVNDVLTGAPPEVGGSVECECE